MLGLFTRLANAIHKRLAPESFARKIGVKLGKECRLIDVEFSTEPYLVTLGDHVSATATRFETHDGGVWVFRHEHPELDVIRRITVGSNVFIGYGTIVLPGVTIGDNVVIGAGSVVTANIPSNAVAVGVPARVIKTLEEYKVKVLTSGIKTKHMSWIEKRAYLTRIADTDA